RGWQPLLTPAPASRETPIMKRLAIGIALGLLAGPFTGCEKGEGRNAIAPGDKREDGDQHDDHDDGDKPDDRDATITVADAMKYIPDGANLLVGMDAAKVAGSAVMKDNQYLLTQGEAGELIAAADACKVGMSTWKYAVVGGNTEEDQELVAVFSATDVGRKDTLECIGKKVTETNPQERFEVGEEDGRVVVSGGRDSQKMYAVSNDVVAIVGAAWQEVFTDLLGGKGQAALDGSLKDVLASLDQSKHIYFGMVATAEMQEGPASTLKYVTGTVDLSAGVSIALSGEFADAAKATEFAGMANKQYDELKGMAGAFGIPYGVVESVKIQAEGGALAITANAVGDDLKQLSEMIKKDLAAPRDVAPQD
ncbi:MAG: hypothetical protein KUG77_15505, partial [Nannocystaceae bacterium]|nr:hypothetical protein [Nannocystaceae bacterium]